jgi:hypothetical protein
MHLNEKYTEVHIDKNVSKYFPIQNGLRQGDALSPFFLKCVVEYAIRKVQENQVGLKLNVAHQLMVYADIVNLLADNIGIIKTDKLFDTSKELV